MIRRKNIDETENPLVKSTEYPVIYSYIYERESQDIKRLSNDFKNVRIKKLVKTPETKVIIEYAIIDGRASPVYETTQTSKKTIRTSARVEISPAKINATPATVSSTKIGKVATRRTKRTQTNSTKSNQSVKKNSQKK